MSSHMMMADFLVYLFTVLYGGGTEHIVLTATVQRELSTCLWNGGGGGGIRRKRDENTRERGPRGRAVWRKNGRGMKRQK